MSTDNPPPPPPRHLGNPGSVAVHTRFIVVTLSLSVCFTDWMLPSSPSKLWIHFYWVDVYLQENKNHILIRITFLKIWWPPFVGPSIPMFWTSGDVCFRFQSQSGSLAFVLCYLCPMDSSDLLLMWNLLASITSESFFYPSVQALMGIELGLECAAHYMADILMTEPLQLGMIRMTCWKKFSDRHLQQECIISVIYRNTPHLVFFK